MVIYLSGQMSGLPDYGVSEFAKYAQKYRDLGHRVISPSEMDVIPPENGRYREFLARDAEAILRRAEAVYMLPNWVYSKGATAERILAETVGIPVFCAERDEAFDRKLEIWYWDSNVVKKVPVPGMSNG